MNIEHIDALKELLNTSGAITALLFFGLFCVVSVICYTVNKLDTREKLKMSAFIVAQQVQDREIAKQRDII